MKPPNGFDRAEWRRKRNIADAAAAAQYAAARNSIRATANPFAAERRAAQIQAELHPNIRPNASRPLFTERTPAATMFPEDTNPLTGWMRPDGTVQGRPDTLTA